MEKMSKQEYLYGKDSDIEPIPEEIIMRRIEALEEHLSELLEVDMFQRDGKRCNSVIRAIQFWRRINEAEHQKLEY